MDLDASCGETVVQDVDSEWPCVERWVTETRSVTTKGLVESAGKELGVDLDNSISWEKMTLAKKVGEKLYANVESSSVEAGTVCSMHCRWSGMKTRCRRSIIEAFTVFFTQVS